MFKIHEILGKNKLELLRVSDNPKLVDIFQGLSAAPMKI